MSSIRLRSRRTLCAVIGALVTMVGAALCAGPAGANGAYTASARVHATKSVTSTVRVRVVATATATAGNPAVRARVTVRVWATATGRATAHAWARAHRSAGTPARARAAARAAAHRKANQRARGRALALARSRALALARAIGQRRAQAAARHAATSQARTLAATSEPDPATPGCTALPKAGGGTWQCTFDEEFDGTSLDPSKWQVLTSAATGLATGGACFVDSPDNVAVGGGVLSLTVRKLAAPMTCPESYGRTISTSYTGGQVGTYGKFSQTYGRFAVRAKFPAAVVAGLQSSLWMWPVKSPTGEIDIAEWYSRYPDRVIPYLHYAYTSSKITSANPLSGTNVVTNNNFLVKDVNAFHEYAVEWTASTITITVDGRVVLIDRVAAYGTSPFNQPFFVALTACLGSGTNPFDPQKTPLPATTQVDWVRAWK